MAVRSRWRWWAVVAVVVVAGTVLAVARGGEEVAGGKATAKQGVALGDRGGAEVGDRAPSFSATTTDGTTFTLPAGRPAAVFFMAGWCSSCLPEAEALADIDREYGDRVAIVAVSADPTDSADTLRRFAEAASARYQFVHDRQGALVEIFQARTLDTTIVVDASGRIVFRDAVASSGALLRQQLARAGLA